MSKKPLEPVIVKHSRSALHYWSKPQKDGLWCVGTYDGPNGTRPVMLTGLASQTAAIAASFTLPHDVKDILVLLAKSDSKLATKQAAKAAKATEPHPARTILPARSDSIRIVPLHVPELAGAPAVEAPPAPPPQLTYRNGPLLSAVEVTTIFWGAAWNTPAQSGLVQKLNQYFDFILTSALMDQMAEYSVPAYKIGHGRRQATATVTTPALRHSVSDRAIQHMLQHEIATNSALPHPTPNSLYFVYLPPGVAVSQGGSRSCQAFCGYHSDIMSQIFYAVMPYPGCSGCAGGLAVLDALTSTSSHELCEAVTDAIPGQGWYDDVHGEIGDICAWKTKKVGAYTVQLEWSNKANACA